MILNAAAIPVGVALVLQNLQSHTVLDLSGTNQVNITGWTPNGGNNQQWIFEPVGSSYTIQNARYKTKYIGYDAPDGRPYPGQLVVGKNDAILWNVSPASGGYKFTVPNDDLVLDLDYEGNTASGNPAGLARENGASSQEWRVIYPS